MTKYKHGDIFSIPLSEKEFAFGRILLDVENQCVKKKKLLADSSLSFFNGVLLISLYKQSASDPENFKASDTLIDACFVGRQSFLSTGKWKIVGHEPVDVEALDFPEFVNAAGAFDAEFVKGEISRTFEQLIKDTQALNIHPSSFPGLHLAAAYLYMTGRENEITQKFAEKKVLDLHARDLRFSPQRGVYLEKANYNAGKSYYENALEAGFDLKRFYE